MVISNDVQHRIDLKQQYPCDSRSSPQRSPWGQKKVAVVVAPLRRKTFSHRLFP